MMHNVIYVVFACNEQHHIARCLTSIIQQNIDAPIYVLVNGSSDNTAHIARSFTPKVHVIEYARGGKARTWNRFFLQELHTMPQVCIIIDGDCYLASHTVNGLLQSLQQAPHAHAAACMPLYISQKKPYSHIDAHTFWGGCYALRGTFIANMKQHNIALPDDLIGDDGYLNALVKSNFGHNNTWYNDAVTVSTTGGFFFDKMRLWHVHKWGKQYKRMQKYALRHYQNQIISHYMNTYSAHHVPHRLSDVYADFLPTFYTRKGIWRWFDWCAQRAIKKTIAQQRR